MIWLCWYEWLRRNYKYMVIIHMMGGDVYVVNDMVVRLPVVSNNHHGRRGCRAIHCYI